MPTFREQLADTWQTAVERAATEKLRLIAANREKLLEAWIAETGLLPSESELVETRHADGAITVIVRAKR